MFNDAFPGCGIAIWNILSTAPGFCIIPASYLYNMEIGMDNFLQIFNFDHGMTDLFTLCG